MTAEGIRRLPTASLSGACALFPPRAAATALALLLALSFGCATPETPAAARTTATTRTPTPTATPTPTPAAETTDATLAHDGELDEAGWAALLVSHPLASQGQRQAVAATWLDLVVQEPSHPLAEGTLALLEQVLTEVEDPVGFAERVMTLDAAELAARGLSAMGQRRLQRLQGRLWAGHAPAEELSRDLFAGYLAQFSVLGPLPRGADPLVFGADLPLATEPGFERAHASFGQGRARAADVPAEVRWQAVQRSPLRPFVLPEAATPGRDGLVALAVCFDTPDGGPAWLEIESSVGGVPFFELDAPGDSSGRGPDWETSSGFFAPGPEPARSRGAVPYSVTLNGEPATRAALAAGHAPTAEAFPAGRERCVIDPLGREVEALVRIPVSLRTSNTLLLFTPVGTRAAFALRVLDEEGRPLPGLRERPATASASASASQSVASTATATAAVPTGPAPLRTRDLLLAREAQGPLQTPQQALAGVLLFLDGEEALGLDRLRSAHERVRGDAGLAALCATFTARAEFLPGSWRRGEARRLAEAALARDPEQLSAGLRLAQIEADEDREADALARLRALSERHLRQADSLLALENLLSRAGLEVAADAALASAQSRAPQRLAVLARQAARAEARGQYWRSTELRLAALRGGGATGPGLHDIARRLGGLGRRDEAGALLLEAVRRDDSAPLQLALARQLIAQQDLDGAEALLAELQRRWPWWVAPFRERAAVALRRGDIEAEREQWQGVLARQPSDRPARERLAALGQPDPARAAFDAHGADPEAVLAAWDGTTSRDSVVRVLDHAVVHVREDGSSTTWTQDLWQARDLSGCEELGSQRVFGEVLSIATRTADGRSFEPVLVAGEYVMPNLRPGDFVLVVSRRDSSPPRDGLLRLGAWSFASEEQPFHLSRYVVDLPGSLPVELHERNLAGVVEHVTHAADGRVVHVFEARDQARVLPEPLLPDRSRFLPVIEFGLPDDLPVLLAGLELRTREAVAVTPQVRRAAAQALAELPADAGDTARARALYDFTGQIISRPGSAGATTALITREGSGNALFAALLAAAEVPHELLWSRDNAPAAEPDPDPAFAGALLPDRRLLVAVHPRDGDVAFCDRDVEGLPYGELMANAPGAWTVSVPSRRFGRLPEVPLSEGVTVNHEVDLLLAPDGSAQATVVIRPSGGLQHVWKSPLRAMPAVQRQAFVQQLVQGALADLDLHDSRIEQLGADEGGLSVICEGRVRALFSTDADGLGGDLPLSRLELTGALAGGEGPRRLPLFMPQSIVQHTRVLFRLAPGLEWGELPASLHQELAGGEYRLDVELQADGALTIERRIALPPFTLTPGQHAAFAAACARIDAAERGQLRLSFVPVPAEPAAPSEPPAR